MSFEDFNIKRNSGKFQHEYFIDTYGKVIKYSGDLNKEICSFHSEIARELYPSANKPTDVLMNLGFIMVGSTVYGGAIIHKVPTQAQLNTIYDLGLNEVFSILHNDRYIYYKDYNLKIQILKNIV